MLSSGLLLLPPDLPLLSLVGGGRRRVDGEGEREGRRREGRRRREGGMKGRRRVGGSELVGELAAADWGAASSLASWVRERVRERDGFVGMKKKKKKRKRNERPDRYMYKVFSDEIGFVTITYL